MKNLNEIVDDLLEKYAQDTTPTNPPATDAVDSTKLTDDNRLAIIEVLEKVNDIYSSVYKVMEGSDPAKLFNSNKANDLYLNLKANKSVLTNAQAQSFVGQLNNALNTLTDKINAARTSVQKVKFS